MKSTLNVIELNTNNSVPAIEPYREFIVQFLF